HAKGPARSIRAFVDPGLAFDADTDRHVTVSDPSSRTGGRQAAAKTPREALPHLRLGFIDPKPVGRKARGDLDRAARARFGAPRALHQDFPSCASSPASSGPLPVQALLRPAPLAERIRRP